MDEQIRRDMISIHWVKDSRADWLGPEYVTNKTEDMLKSKTTSPYVLECIYWRASYFMDGINEDNDGNYLDLVAGWRKVEKLVASHKNCPPILKVTIES